eukprot:48950_1
MVYTLVSYSMRLSNIQKRFHPPLVPRLGKRICWIYVSYCDQTQQKISRAKRRCDQTQQKLAPYLRRENASQKKMWKLYHKWLRPESTQEVNISYERRRELLTCSIPNTELFQDIDSTTPIPKIKRSKLRAVGEEQKEPPTKISMQGLLGTQPAGTCPPYVWWSVATEVKNLLVGNQMVQSVRDYAALPIKADDAKLTLLRKLVDDWPIEAAIDVAAKTAAAHGKLSILKAHSGHYNQLSMPDDHYEDEIRYFDSYITESYPHRYLYPQKRIGYANMRMDTYGGYDDVHMQFVLACMAVMVVILASIAVCLAICLFGHLFLQRRVFERKKQPVYVYRRADDVDEDCNL